MKLSKSYRESVAVIGGGIAGLTAAHVLSRHFRVTLYEADARLGGHAHTHQVDRGDGVLVGLDSAFLVHNDRTYPTLCRLFQELEVATQQSDMSMSVRSEQTGLEYAGALGLKGLFPSIRAISPRYLGMLAEILRFHRAARRVLRLRSAEDETLEMFLSRHRFSGYFTDNFMTPLVAAVWSCDPTRALDFPAASLFAFLAHHGMLTVFGSPAWRTVVGGSARYVEKIAAEIADVRLGARVGSVRRLSEGVLVFADGSPPEKFAAVVIATHADQALAMLDDPTPAERSVLGAFEYSANFAQLHTDESLLPRLGGVRASWNYLVPAGTKNAAGVVVTYDVSRLMRVEGSDGRRFLVTLGGRGRVDSRSVLAEMTYRHPLCTMASVRAQALLPSLGDSRLVFAGAYHGWGFHEDGAASGREAARRLGASWADASAEDAQELSPC